MPEREASKNLGLGIAIGFVAIVVGAIGKEFLPDLGPTPSLVVGILAALILGYIGAAIVVRLGSFVVLTGFFLAGAMLVRPGLDTALFHRSGDGRFLQSLVVAASGVAITVLGSLVYSLLTKEWGFWSYGARRKKRASDA